MIVTPVLGNNRMGNRMHHRVDRNHMTINLFRWLFLLFDSRNAELLAERRRVLCNDLFCECISIRTFFFISESNSLQFSRCRFVNGLIIGWFFLFWPDAARPRPDNSGSLGQLAAFFHPLEVSLFLSLRESRER